MKIKEMREALWASNTPTEAQYAIDEALELIERAAYIMGKISGIEAFKEAI